MNISDWLYSLTVKDQLVLILIYLFCIYLSKISLKSLISIYDERKKYSKYRIELRISAGYLLSLAFIYSIILYRIVNSVFNF
jgi:hypothetical protein